jgi:cytochrome c oxidase assembly protein subunit 15
VTRPRLSPPAYHRITLLALVSLAAIVVTGAVVRLTGSGLGCPDWPTCDHGKLVDPTSYHRAVENINRMFTGLVSVAVILAVLGSMFRVPRRTDLVVLSWSLVAGVLAQAVTGAVVVETGLNPVAVAGHFALSLVVVVAAVVLHHRAGERRGPYRRLVPDGLWRHVVALAVTASVVVVLGTVVTGSGPHGGDERAHRFDVSISHAARLHGTAVVVFLALTLWFLQRARHSPAWAVVERPSYVLLWALCLQGGLGYLQYFTGVPALLVGFHVVGAVAVTIAVADLVLTCREPVAGQPASGAEPQEVAVP